MLYGTFLFVTEGSGLKTNVLIVQITQVFIKYIGSVSRLFIEFIYAKVLNFSRLLIYRV